MLLFLSVHGEEEGCLASSTFESEAKKMDVMWTSRSTNDASLENLQGSDLVIVLQKPGLPVSLQSLCPSWTGKSEIWDLPDTADCAGIIQKNVGSLLVRLILQGGKREPAAAAPEAKQIQKANAAPSSKDAVRVTRESKGRGGKTVTVISGLTLEEAQLRELAARLKQLCGTGGTIKDGKIEIQGDQCARIMTELQNRGYKAKRAGG